MTFTPARPSRGFTFIELLLAVVIVVGAGATLSVAYGNLAKYVRYNRMISDKISARNAILGGLDCTAVLPTAAGCTSNHSVLLLDLNGASLTDQLGKIGSWQISGRCQAGSGIVVEGLWAGGTQHPLTNAPLTKAPLFPNGVAFCRDAITGKPPVQSLSAVMTNTNYKCSADNLPNWKSWEGTLTCPAGYMAVGGGVNCGNSALQQSSTPMGAGFTQWYGKCCVLVGGAAPTVYVQCALAD